MGNFNCFVLFLLCILSIVSAIERPRGVPLQKATLYTGDEFRCFSNGKIINGDYVNDDYCDCEDGSDEPGTAACNNGQFFCENKPYVGNYIPSTRVNDGICDCCDGSDEYDGTITCENTCDKIFAAIRAAEEELRKKREAGYKVKLEYIQQGKRSKDESVGRLSELEATKDNLIQERTNMLDAKNAAEEPEIQAKEKHEAAWNAIKEEKKKAKEVEISAKAFNELDANSDGIVDFPEIQNHIEFDIDSDGSVSYEEAKEYLEDKEEVDLSFFSEKIWPNIKEIYKLKATEESATEASESTESTAQDQGTTGTDPGDAHDIPVNENDEGIEEGHSDLGEEYHDQYDDEDYLDNDDEDEEEDDELDLDVDGDYDLEKREWVNKRRGRENLDKADGDDEDKMPEYDEETKTLIAAADEARHNYNEIDSKVKDMEKEISGIKSYMELDMGIEEEFAPLKGQCFEYTEREYVYKFCPFEKTSQKPAKGGIETSLGVWGKWFGPKEDKYSAMKFENGQGCWNGPARSCHVNLHCGAENALTAASEPSRCEYQFEFSTPARCDSPQQASTKQPFDHGGEL